MYCVGTLYGTTDTMADCLCSSFSRSRWVELLDVVHCQIVSTCSNGCMDAYLLRWVSAGERKEVLVFAWSLVPRPKTPHYYTLSAHAWNSGEHDILLSIFAIWQLETPDLKPKLEQMASCLCTAAFVSLPAGWQDSVLMRTSRFCVLPFRLLSLLCGRLTLGLHLPTTNHTI